MKSSESPFPRPAVFFDRDGTLMEEVHYCREPGLVRAFSGSASALRKLRESGFLRVIITNQSGLGRGTIQMHEYEAVQAELTRQLEGEIDAVYFCADVPDAATNRRKPGTGMVDEAIRDLDIRREGSWFVGDKELDLRCGRAAGLQTILVRTGYGKQIANTPLADAVCDDVADAVSRILEHQKDTGCPAA